MTRIEHSTLVADVVLVHLQSHPDDRGRFLETYRRDWFPDTPPMVQGNRSDSHRRVLRGLHYHRRQADYWYVPSGRLFVVLHDLRTGSSTSGATQTVEMGRGAEVGLYIPPGVAHGFQALEDATLTYLVDRSYDPDDELGLAWDDPAVGAGWPLDDPILSDRDRSNPQRAAIAPGLLPQPAPRPG